MTDPFTEEDVPGQPGWRFWHPSDPTRFNSLLGPISYRVEGEVARVRLTPEHQHSNVRDRVHGGVTLAFIDVALFAAARGFGLVTAGTAVTLGLDTQFIGEGRIGEPLEAQVEVLRETGRLLFLRGLVVQGEGRTKVAAFSATIRKPSPSTSHPGEGRAQLERPELAVAAPRFRIAPTWAPAFAGVQEQR